MTSEEELEYFKSTGSSKIPDKIKFALDIMVPHCPSCGSEVNDKRYKRRCFGSPVWCRNFSDTGITLECRCSLRWHFTWQTFVNMMKKKVKTEPAEKMREWMESWIAEITFYFGLKEEGTLAKIERKLTAIKEAKIK